jgi:hypothetical protein
MSRKKTIILNDVTFDTGSVFKEAQNKLDLNKEQKKEEFLLDSSVQKKRGRKKRSKMYFTQETENAIVRYNNAQNIAEKHKIYNDEIQYALEKLAENIINTFKFSYIGEQYKDIKIEVVSKMIIEMEKYDQSKGKAFSYFSIIAKNHLIISNNEAYKELKVTKSIDESFDNSDNVEYDILDETYNIDIIKSETQEFIRLLVEYWENNITSVFKKDRDIEIAYAVMELFRNVNSLEFFNKKALYLLIREMTGHRTQYITRVINKMTTHYAEVKDMYLTDGTIEEEPFFTNKKK